MTLFPDHRWDHPDRDFVAIARRYNLALRDRQLVKGREEEAEGLRPITSGWNIDEE